MSLVSCHVVSAERHGESDECQVSLVPYLICVLSLVLSHISCVTIWGCVSAECRVESDECPA